MNIDTPATSPASRLSVATALVASVMFVTFLMVSTSRAAFSDTTDNTTNSAGSGDVVLVDDDGATAMFAVTNLGPTDSVSECILVTYNGSIVPTVPVSLYAAGANGGTGLDQYLDMTVEVGTGGDFASCAGFVPTATVNPIASQTLQNFAATRTAFATGASTGWTPSGTGDARTFRVTLTLQDDNAAQGLEATFGFTWEVQS